MELLFLLIKYQFDHRQMYNPRLGLRSIGLLGYPNWDSPMDCNVGALRHRHCSVVTEDTMKLQALGLGASQFQLHRGTILMLFQLELQAQYYLSQKTTKRPLSEFSENRGPLPLSEIPPTCRCSMQRNALGLVMVAPYDGCNIIKEVIFNY